MEFDGPSHFLSSRAPTGATLLKRRHLQLLGYVLVSVPYWEWDACKGQVEREQYLRLKARSADRHRHNDGYGDREVLARERSSRSRSRDQTGDGRDGRGLFIPRTK